MLRTKLLIAFAAMAVLTALCGGVSVYLIGRIGSAVTVYADVTSPLQTEATALLEDARRMRTIALGAIGDEKAAIPAGQIDELDNDSKARLAALERLQKTAGIDIDLAALRSLESEYAVTLRTMLAASAAARNAQALSAEQRTELDGLRRDAQAVLRAVAARAESAITEMEEKSKVEHETGRATTDSLAASLSELLTEIYRGCN